MFTIRRHWLSLPLASLVSWALVGTLPVQAEPIAIAEVRHDGDVDFEKEILPIFRRQCLACHNNTDAESDLVLETPATLLKGGSTGAAVVAGKSAESLLLKVASKQSDPLMPPEDNDVGAKPLTPDELGLIKLWIDQGAKGEVTGVSGPIQWQPLPPGVNPVYSVAVSPDGQFAAAGRANQIFLYHLPSKREVGRLTDPGLIEKGIYTQPGVADLDLIQSLRFSPDSQLLASGGYRTVKFWQRARNTHKLDLAGFESALKSLATSPDGKWAALGEDNGKVRLFDLSNGSLARTIEGHAGAVTGVAFSADSAKLATGGQDKTFRVWNVADGQALGKVETAAPVNAVAFVVDSTQIATGGADNIIRIWALPAVEPPAEPQKPVKEIGGHGGPVTSLVALAPNGAQLLSGSQDGTARVWDVNGGNQVRQMNHGGPVTSVAARADGQRVASASSNNSAKLWDANGQPVAELKGDFRTRIAVEDVTRVLAVSKREIDSTKGDLKAATDRKDAEEKNSTAAEEARKKAEEDYNKKTEEAKKPLEEKAAADKALVDAQAAQAKAEADRKASEEQVIKAGEAITKAQAEVVAADKLILETTAAAKVVTDTLAESLAKLQEAAKAQADNKALAELAAAVDLAVKNANDAQQKAAVAAKAAAQKAIVDGEALKKASEEAKKVAEQAIAKAQTDAKAADENVKKLAGPAQKAMDERTAAERALQSAMRTVERAKEAVKKAIESIPPIEATVKTAEEKAKQIEEQLKVSQQTATESEKPFQAVAFSPDGLTLATAGDDQMVHTWDSETGAAIENYQGQGAAIVALAFTPDRNILSAAANNTAIVWDTNPEWKLVRTIGSVDATAQFIDRVTALDFSPDGKILATGGGEPSRSGELKLWNVADGSLLREVPDAHSDVIYGLEFSPDGKQLASSGSDRFAKIFEVETGKFIRGFEGHTHHVLGVSWRADGRLLATGGADAVIKVWDVRTGDQARTIAGFNKEVTAIRFVADGDNVVASCGDNSVQMKNAANGGNVRAYGGAADFMYAVGVSANGKTIVAGGQDSAVRVWKEDGQVWVTFEAPKPEAAGAE